METRFAVYAVPDCRVAQRGAFRLSWYIGPRQPQFSAAGARRLKRRRMLQTATLLRNPREVAHQSRVCRPLSYVHRGRTASAAPPHGESPPIPAEASLGWRWLVRAKAFFLDRATTVTMKRSALVCFRFEAIQHGRFFRSFAGNYYETD